MSKKLDELFETYAYDARQKTQLRLADEKGLDISKMKDPKFNWEQMREISLAMEYGLKPDTLCDPEINAESMEKIRYSLMDQQSVFEDAKEEVKKHLINEGYDVIDVGTNSTDSCNYAEFGIEAAKKVSSGEATYGVVICSSGEGISIAANKVKGAYAALLSDVYSAQTGTEKEQKCECRRFTVFGDRWNSI